MPFGLHLGTRGAAAHPDNLVALAQHADALGFAHLGFSDHVVIAAKIDSRYPYSESGDWRTGIPPIDSLARSPILRASAVTGRRKRPDGIVG